MNDNEKNIYFSVIVCCYNSEKYLDQTLESICKQSYSYWEIVIINDGSTDLTEKIVKKFINNKVPIIYYKTNKNLGFSKARNKAIELSSYDWIVMMDHDDIALPNRLKIHSNEIVNNKNCNLFFGDAHFFNKQSMLLSRFQYFRKKNNIGIDDIKLTKTNLTNNLLRYGCFIVSSTVVFDKKNYYLVSGFDENLKFIADYDFFLKLSNQINFHCTKFVLCKWRVHSDQASKIKLKEQYKELFLLFMKYFFYRKIKFKIRIYVLFKSLAYLVKYFVFWILR